MARFRFARLCRLAHVAVFFALLALPALTHHWQTPPAVQESENRSPSPLPSRPESWRAAAAWPKQADHYLADHFGGRTAMVAAFNRARWRLFGQTPSEQTVFGRRGRLFLTSHSADRPYSLIAFVCGAGVDDAEIDRAVGDLAAFLRQAETFAANSYLMVVPTSPALYADDLPGWLRLPCPADNTMDRLMRRLPPGDLRDRLDYPLAALQKVRGRGEAIPLMSFHWLGAGAEAAAASFAEGRLGLPHRPGLPARDAVAPSDLRFFTPGIPTGNAVRLPDFAAAGVDWCAGAACFPELGEAAGIIGDESRALAPSAGGKKLLILSDSFGIGLAGWFAAYFGTVEHFSVSNMHLLSAGQRAAFRRHVFAEYRPDVVLYVFHDGSVHYWPKLAAEAVWGP
jgi:hypothetical protein